MLIGRSVHIGRQVEVEVEVETDINIDKKRSRIQRGQGVCHHGIKDRGKLAKIELLW